MTENMSIEGVDFIALNLASVRRMEQLATTLTDDQFKHPVGEHWTVGITFAHLAFWDRRVMHVLSKTEAQGSLFVPEIDIFVNDLSLPLWAAIPPHEAARIAIEAAQALDQRLAEFPTHLREAVFNYNRRWVFRALHRNEHLDEVDQALKPTR